MHGNCVWLVVSLGNRDGGAYTGSTAHGKHRVHRRRHASQRTSVRVLHPDGQQRGACGKR